MDLWSLQQIRQGFRVIDFEAGGDRLVGERKIIKKSEERKLIEDVEKIGV